MDLSIKPDLTADELLHDSAGHVTLLAGANFSGRSDTLRTLAQYITQEGQEAILIPAEIHPALSGLVSTVEEELMLHLAGSSSYSPCWQLAKEWGLTDLFQRNPHSLSGGQQALLVILCRLGRMPRFLGLDCALEQLDPQNHRKVLAALSDSTYFPSASRAFIAHNGSWPHDVKPVRTVCPIVNARPSPPKLDASLFQPSGIAPCVLEVRNATFSYPGGSVVFSNLNLKLKPGSVYRLAGPNGAGKSTFARILCGILRLNSGSILVNGDPYDPYPHPGTLARLHFQNPDAQLFGEPVRNELSTLPPSMREAATRFAGLGPFLDTHPFDLPFVLRKRLALTLIFHTEAPWLIFDEPTVGLDEEAQSVIATCMERLASAGYGVIFISHNERLTHLLSPTVLYLESDKS